MNPVAPRFEFVRRAFAWRRMRVALVAAALLGTLFALAWKGVLALLYLRLVLVGMALLTVFAVIESWPRTLPRWVARWALQILGVAVAAPFAVAAVYAITTIGDPIPWFRDKERMTGFSLIAGVALFTAPWVAMVAVYRDISGRAQRQALQFELERSQYAQQALQARMSLLQAQVEPHFLFNTLANIRELVQQGSPNAPDMLESLVDYLRAAVPRLHETDSTVGRELDLVRSYLAIMQMRMPDRLRTEVRCEPEAADVRCPPGSILVLAENAVRHGIDPSEAGGSILVEARVEDAHCVVEVVDTGMGLGGSAPGLGTGLANLGERLKLGYGPAATIEVRRAVPSGTRACLRLPRGGTHES